MALTDSDKSRVIDMLDRLDRNSLKTTLASENSFLGWLKSAASWLWQKFKDFWYVGILNQLWSFFF